MQMVPGVSSGRSARQQPRSHRWVYQPDRPSPPPPAPAHRQREPRRNADPRRTRRLHLRSERRCEGAPHYADQRQQHECCPCSSRTRLPQQEPRQTERHAAHRQTHPSFSARRRHPAAHPRSEDGRGARKPADDEQYRSGPGSHTASVPVFLRPSRIPIRRMENWCERGLDAHTMTGHCRAPISLLTAQAKPVSALSPGTRRRRP